MEGEEDVDYEADVPQAQDLAHKQAQETPEATETKEEPSSPVKAQVTEQTDAAVEGSLQGGPLADPADPADPLSLPPHGTEVFVGGLPKNATEEQIREFAAQSGEVHSVKLAKDPNNSQQNRGFGFVRYLAKTSADAAKEKLHETQLPGTESRVRISSSQSKHRVYVGNLPRAWSKEQLLAEFERRLKGLEATDLVMSKEVSDQNRGFAFLTFYNHECAAAGKDFLSKPSYSIEGRQLTVSYAENKNVEAQSTKQPNKAVYVGNLPSGATEEKLKDIFKRWGEVSKVVIPAATEKRPEQRFGFIHFAEHTSAEQAVADAAAGQKPEMEENPLEVKAARPQPSLPDQRHGRFGSPGGYDMGSGGPGRVGRGASRGPRGGRGVHGGSFRGRGRGGRSAPHGRSNFPAYNTGYDDGFDDNYWGAEPRGLEYGYDAFTPAGGLAVAAPAAASPGMTMVPMMLPSGQVGYVLQSANGIGATDYGAYGGGGPERAYGGHNNLQSGRGRGRSSRYRPY